MEPIKQEIVNNIYENGENLITGPVLQEVLLDMVDDTNAKISSSVGDVVTLITEVSESALRPEDLEGYATEQWVEEQGYLKEVPEGYATTESLNQLSESVSASISSIPSVDLSGYATTQSVNEATESVKEWVESKHYLTTASLSGSVTEESVRFMINDSTASMKEWVESQSYATETFVSESIASLDIPDTSGFVTTQSYNLDSASFDERINAITGSDLSGYATTESLNQLSESVASDSASFDERISSIVVPDLSSYATTESLNTVSQSLSQSIHSVEGTLADKAEARDLTSLSESVASDLGLLEERVTEVESGKVDWDTYDTERSEFSQSVAQDVTNLSASIAAITGSDLSGYVTTASYNTDSASFDQRINSMSGSEGNYLPLTGGVLQDPESDWTKLEIHSPTGEGGFIELAAGDEGEASLDLAGVSGNEVRVSSEGNLEFSWNDEGDEGSALLELPKIDGEDTIAVRGDITSLSESVAQSFEQNIPDVSIYATTESLNQLSESVAQDLEGKADKSDLPDLSTYATTESLNTVSQSLSASIATITGSSVDLSGYATTESVNNLSSSVGNISSSFADTIANLPTGSGGGDYLPITGGYVTGPTRFEKLGVGFDPTNFSNGQARISKLGVGRNPSTDDGQLVVSKNIQVGGNSNNFDTGDRCIAVGSSGTNTNGAHYSIAVGENCHTSVYGGFVAGRENVVESNGAFGTATGFRCRTIAMAGYAGGCRSTASANFGTAIGFGAEAKALGQVVLGSYNEYDPTGDVDSTGSYAVIFGIGKSSTWNQDRPGDIVRSNGLAIKWDGGIDINYSGSTITLQDKIAELEQGGADLVEIWVRGTGSGSAVLSGSFSRAEGNFAVAGGLSDQASGVGSHAEGYQTTASGYYSHAEGHLSRATANAAHAEGSSYAEGSYSHAEGQNATARGAYSHAEGLGTLATNPNEHAEGKYNATASNQIFSVGSGTGIGGEGVDLRRNAISILTSSHGSASVFVQGIGGYNGQNPQEGVNDVASVIANLVARIEALESGSNV